MTYELRFQDASSPYTKYLDEEIMALLLDPDVAEIDAIFAFASVAGVVGVVGDPAFGDYIRRGVFRLLVGLDAVTDRRTLEFLLAARAKVGANFQLKVFRNQRNGLFHPKLLRSRRTDGSGTLLVGSGNFTPGGLRSNLEAFSVLRYSAGVPADDSEWDRFLAEHTDEIVDVDEDALERAAQNGVRMALGRRLARRKPRGRVRREEADEAAAALEEERIDLEEAASPSAADRMLVAVVPRAKGRWHQVHFNAPAIDDYFRAQPNSAERVLLYRVEPGGVVPEPPRPVVYSVANKNHKIEFRAHRGESYPAGGPPILVLRELGLRTHSYVMLFPGEPGYTEMTAFLASRNSIGRGAKRVIATRPEVEAAWPSVPV